MEQTLDARGLHCPLPLVKARAALAGLAPGDVLVVLATDPEAPIDIAALAADGGHALATQRAADHWRLTLVVAAGPDPTARTRWGREPGEPPPPT
jgi:tRNA 2-thiouridine synthesizing protein A